LSIHVVKIVEVIYQDKPVPVLFTCTVVYFVDFARLVEFDVLENGKVVGAVIVV
jgi:hypothetical protein